MFHPVPYVHLISFAALVPIRCLLVRRMHDNARRQQAGIDEQLLELHRNYWDSPAKVNVAFKSSFFLEDNNVTIYLGVKHMLTELLQPQFGTIRCTYLCDLAVHKDHLPHHRMMSQSALLL